MSEQRELTAMMGSIEWVESNLITSNSVIAKATELLAKEKSQIEAAYNEGYRDGELDAASPTYNGDVSEYSNADHYYSLTYKSEVK
jgi:hypothetical protein